MKEVFPDFSNEATGADCIAVIGGIVVGLGVMFVESDYLWHVNQGQATVSSINRQEAYIHGLQVGEGAFRNEPQPLRSEADSVIGHRLNSANAKLQATVEHNPYYAGGQLIENAALGLSGIAILGTIGFVASKKIRKLLYNHKNTQSDHKENDNHPVVQQTTRQPMYSFDTTSSLTGFREILDSLKF